MIKKSPLNYSGSKDKILPQILNELPEDINTFVDAFGGAFNVGVNVNANKVIYNEINPYIYEIVKLLLTEDKDKLINDIEKIIKDFNLEKKNKISYNKFRDYYNNMDKSPINLYILSLYSFSNIIRFNKNQEFNSSIGKQEYNKTIIDRILNFKSESNKTVLYNLSYKDIPLDENCFFYFDPPYITTTGVYNETNRFGNGWTKNDEQELLDYIKILDNNNYKFMLSNVLKYKDKENTQLINFINDNNFKLINIGKYRTRQEVIIKNY